MKKFLILACGLCITSAGYAQTDVLKDAERGLRVEVPDHARIAAMLEGAMKDPATADNVKTWFLAGKNAFQTWQTGYEQLQQGGNPDKVNMSRAIINGYDYFMKALPMDTVVDAKGKVKTKYSKEIAKTLSANPTNFYDAGVFLYEANDLKNAYRAWEIYTELPTLKQLGKDVPPMPEDSIMGTTFYNMGIFAYQGDMKREAMNSFVNATKYNHGEVAYENALAMATELNDTEAIEKIALEGFNKYGKQSYIGALVNVYVKSGNFEKAKNMVDKALEANPDNAILYNVKGILIENRTNDEGISNEEIAAVNREATQLYAKAVELDPDFAEARYNYGRIIANEAYRINDSPEASELSIADFNKLKENTIDPMLRSAAEQLEVAIKLEPDSFHQAYRILENIYYNLQDEENMERIKAAALN